MAGKSRSYREAELLFDKIFSFESSKEWQLPSVDVLNSEKTWVLESLQDRKKELNAVKSLLNDKGVLWHNHTKAINKAGLIHDSIKKIIRPEFLSQAWCKFYEIVCMFPIISTDVECFGSLHLCEAPGGFVSALNYYLCLNHWDLAWQWYGNTLNPYYEGHSVKHAVVDDRLLYHTLENWYFGRDNTGDVLSPSYVSDLEAFLAKKGEIHLVTADGSISCSEDPAEQELIVAQLQLAEVLIALNTLAPDGAFVIKKFTLFECISVCVMYLLNCLFDEVHVFKPVTSRSGNSEVYVVCLGYNKMDDFSSYSEKIQKQLNSTDFALFPQNIIPTSFIEQLHKCCDVFMSFQIASINENIQLFDNMTSEKRKYLEEVKNHCVHLYIHKYSLTSLDRSEYYKLYTGKSKSILTAYGGCTSDLRNLYHSVLGSTFEKIEQYKTMSWEERLWDIESRFNTCFPISKKRPSRELRWIPVQSEIIKATKFSKQGSYKNWVVVGKAFDVIENSKFGNPLLLLLWNELVNKEQKVFSRNHFINSCFNWDWESFKNMIRCRDLEKADIILDVQLSKSAFSAIAVGFESTICCDSKVHAYYLNGSTTNSYCNKSKIVVIDMTCWGMESFNFEITVKHDFVKALLAVIPVLKCGDTMAICFPSLLTRFMVGILFLLLSLFAESTTIIPEDISPALTGQIWVLGSFQKPFWTSLVLQSLQHISSCIEASKESCRETVLEVVPIPYICSCSFYNYLLDINHACMMQRLCRLISVEKKLLRK